MSKTIKHNRQLISLFVVLVVVLSLFLIFVLPRFFNDHYVVTPKVVATVASTTLPLKIVFTPSYVSTPEIVKGIYMTSWIASRSDLRANLVKIIDETELNTVVIDVKDYSGKVTFPIESPELKSFGSEEIRITDLQDFIESLHKKGIYVIARLAVFQDAYFVKFRPDLAVKNRLGTAVWKDRKGISWIDPGSKEYWDYIILVSKEVRKVGFDEINFDYIRYPSDGNMQDISYPFSSTTPKSVVLKNFFKYLHDNLTDPGLKISADLFGMTTTAQDDMGIGQLLENALPYFDYIMPMVYPSHYPSTFEGFAEPEAHPYEVVKYAMQSAIDRAIAMNPVSTSVEVVNGATTTVKHIEDLKYKDKLRPWLQDFGLRMTYGPEEVKAQVRATNEVGLTSWMLWSASNKYTRGALQNQ